MKWAEMAHSAHKVSTDPIPRSRQCQTALDLSEELTKVEFNLGELK